MQIDRHLVQSTETILNLQAGPRKSFRRTKPWVYPILCENMTLIHCILFQVFAGINSKADMITIPSHLQFMPLSHYRQYVPLFEVLLCYGTTPRSPHFVQVVHTTDRQPLIGHRFTTVNNSRIRILRTLVTQKQPSLTSTHFR